MDDKPLLDRVGLTAELLKFEQAKEFPPHIQLPIDQRALEIKGLLQAQKTPESRHKTAAKRLGKAKQRMEK